MTQHKNRAWYRIMALSPVIVFLLRIIVSLIFWILQSSGGAFEWIAAIKVFCNRLLGLGMLASFILCPIGIIRLNNHTIDPNFDITTVPATRNELNEQQKNSISKKLLWWRIASIVVPWIAVLYARKYGVFFIVLGIAAVVGFIFWFRELSEEHLLFISLVLDLMYVVIVIIKLPERAYNTSK